MNYKLTKIALDVNKPKTSFEFESPYLIKDICGSELGFFFAHSNGVGRIVDNNVEIDWSSQLLNDEPFDDPSSLDFHPITKSIFLCEKGGSQIRELDIFDNRSKRLISDQQFSKKFFRNFNSSTKISVKGDDIVWTVKNQHRCFILNGVIPKPLFGNGKSGYSISSPLSSRFCKPDGITRMGKLFFVADSGNGCVRGTNKDSVLHIMDGLNHPRKLISPFNKLFFIDGQKVHTVSPAGNSASVYEVYDSTNEVISICAIDKTDIYVLENTDGKRKT